MSFHHQYNNSKIPLNQANPQKDKILFHKKTSSNYKNLADHNFKEFNQAKNQKDKIFHKKTSSNYQNLAEHTFKEYIKPENKLFSNHQANQIFKPQNAYLDNNDQEDKEFHTLKYIKPSAAQNKPQPLNKYANPFEEEKNYNYLVKEIPIQNLFQEQKFENFNIFKPNQCKKTYYNNQKLPPLGNQIQGQNMKASLIADDLNFFLDNLNHEKKLLEKKTSFSKQQQPINQLIQMPFFDQKGGIPSKINNNPKGNTNKNQIFEKSFQILPKKAPQNEIINQKSTLLTNTILTLNLIISNEPLKVKIVRRLVEGKTADVFRGIIISNGKDGKEVALKRFKGERGCFLGKNEKTTLEKLRKTKSLQENMNYCQLLGFKEVKSNEYCYDIALEYGKKTLYESMKIKKYNMNEIKRFAEDMIMTFSHFQKIGLFYRDIKPANILLSNESNGLDKIIDFDVSIWLDEANTDNDGNYELSLSGTPKYMAPELYQIYLKMKNAKDNDQLSDGSRKFVVSNVYDQVDIPQEMAEEYDEEKTLQITRKQIKIEDKLDFDKAVSASECFKMDVFSLGLVILELALSFPSQVMKEIKIQDINKTKKNLREALNEFLKIKKNTNFEYLNELLEKMLVWNQEDRLDFLELEDFLIYDKLLDIQNKFKYVEVDQKFTSMTTFKNIWNVKDIIKIQNHFFSAGYLAKTVDNNYIKNIIITSYEPDYTQTLFTQELARYNSYISSGDLLEVLIKLYTLENPFYKDLNKCLGKNQVEKHRYFLTNFLKFKKTLRTPIFDNIVYRVIVLDGEQISKWKYEARNQYFPGLEFYWPSFTSTSRSAIVKQKWLDLKASDKESNIILFVIRINKENLNNKANIENKSSMDESEVLLYPYFHFRVIKNSPSLVKVKGTFRTICQIELEEIPIKVFKIKIIWFDPNIESSSNKSIQDEIKRNYGDVLNKFTKMEDAVSFLENYLFVSIVITCGSQGKEFVRKINEMEHVAKILLFVGNKELHQKWAEKYSKILGVYDKNNELLGALPDRDVFY